MSDTIKLEIVTSTGVGEKVEVTEVYFPSFGKGETGVMYNHLPYLSMVDSGEMNYLDTRGKRHYYYIEEGFIENLDNRIVIITDSLTKAEDLYRDEIKNELGEIKVRIEDAVKGKFSSQELTGFIRDQRIAELKLEIIAKSV